MCIDVLLGSISSDNTYTISYTTTGSDAEGKGICINQFKDVTQCITAPDDYLEQSGYVELTSTATKQCISIPIIDDSIDESDQECFTVSLSSDSADLTLSPAVATLCINDNDGELDN